MGWPDDFTDQFAAGHQDDVDEEIAAAHVNNLEDAVNDIRTVIGAPGSTADSVDLRLGDLEANAPSSGEKGALAGTSGTPGSGNKYVTDGDSRNSNARTPTAHAASHKSGGSDAIKMGELAAPTSAVDFNGQKATGLAAPTTSTDGARKQETDDLASLLAVGLAAKPATTDVQEGLGHNGLYAPMHSHWTYTNTAVTSNRLYCNRFVPIRNMAITSMCFLVPTGASGTNDNVEMGIYSVASASSLSKVQTTGTITPGVNSTGLKTGTLSATANLTAGTVYYAVITLTSTVTCYQANFGTNGGGSFMGTSFTTGVDALIKDSIGPGLASTISSITSQPGTSVLLGLRE